MNEAVRAKYYINMRYRDLIHMMVVSIEVRLGLLQTELHLSADSASVNRNSTRIRLFHYMVRGAGACKITKQCW